MASSVRKVAWPKFKFLETGPKLKGPFPELGFGWELDYYHFLHRWNGGVPLADSFKVKSERGEDTVARVRYFYGFSQGQIDERDLRNAVYRDWGALPRGALPIAALDIEEDEWDLCTLLTFRLGDRDHFNRIFLIENLHEGGPYDPDDLSRLQLVANSLPQFMKSLRPNEYFVYRTWFQIPVRAEELENVAAAFLENDFEDYWGFTDIADSQCGRARHDDLNFDVWLANSDAKIQDIAAPKKVAKDSCILAIDAFRWQHPAAQKHVAAILKPLGLDRKIKKLGETPTRIDERRTKS